MRSVLETVQELYHHVDSRRKQAKAGLSIGLVACASSGRFVSSADIWSLLSGIQLNVSVL
jgi:hypothetical protein